MPNLVLNRDCLQIEWIMHLTSLLCYSCSDLSYNNLEGSFPSWVSDKNLQLYVSMVFENFLYYIYFSDIL